MHVMWRKIGHMSENWFFHNFWRGFPPNHVQNQSCSGFGRFGGPWIWHLPPQKAIRKKFFGRFGTSALFYAISHTFLCTHIKYLGKGFVLEGRKKLRNGDREIFPEPQICWFEHYFSHFGDILIKSSWIFASLRGRISARRWSWMTNEHTGTIYSSRKLVSRCF